MPNASPPPPPGAPGPEASSWRPLFPPQALDRKARSGPTRTSELPAPAEGASMPLRIPAARLPVLDPGRRARVARLVGLALALIAGCALLAALGH